MNYCRCANKFSYETSTKQPAPEGWQSAEVWVCGLCNKINHAVQEEHEVVRGPANATALLSASGRTTGQHTLRWATPDGVVETLEYHTYPRTIPMTHPEPLLFSLWELLQSKIEVIVANRDNQDPSSIDQAGLLAAKAQARGISEALAILMKPFVESPDEVGRHAMKYYKDNTHEVPGLGLHLWNPLYNPDGTLRTQVASPTPKRARPAIKMAPKPEARTLSVADAEFARQGYSANMFSKEDLASMFKVSLETIESALEGAS